jgi:hypothetical protein
MRKTEISLSFYHSAHINTPLGIQNNYFRVVTMMGKLNRGIRQAHRSAEPKKMETRHYLILTLSLVTYYRRR